MARVQMSGKLADSLAGGMRRNLTTITGLFRSPDNETIALSPATVAETRSMTQLVAAEEAILGRLEAWLTGKRMLDVGVGSGRTTPYFAPLVTSYVGIDYSPPMIEACAAALGKRFGNVRLFVADARDLGRFETNSFDLVLFSFMGLDCIGHADRLKALSEFHRVCAPDGFFCFSAHNLCGIGQQFRFRRDEQMSLARRLIFQAALRLLNERPQELVRKPYELVRDGALGFRIYLYYVRPSEQIAQLHSAGFSDVEIYGVDGRRITCDEADQAGDLSLYYLASHA